MDYFHFLRKESKFPFTYTSEKMIQCEKIFYVNKKPSDDLIDILALIENVRITQNLKNLDFSKYTMQEYYNKSEDDFDFNEIDDYIVYMALKRKLISYKLLDKLSKELNNEMRYLNDKNRN